MNTERDEKVIAALVDILNSNVGYEISFFGDALSLYQLEGKRFVVNRYEYDEKNHKSKWVYEEIFDNAKEPVEFFEQKRREYEIVFDIEGALFREDEVNQKQ